MNRKYREQSEKWGNCGAGFSICDDAEDCDAGGGCRFDGSGVFPGGLAGVAEWHVSFAAAVFGYAAGIDCDYGAAIANQWLIHD